MGIYSHGVMDLDINSRQERWIFEKMPDWEHSAASRAWVAWSSVPDGDGNGSESLDGCYWAPILMGPI